jgi:hypothetical protein
MIFGFALGPKIRAHPAGFSGIQGAHVEQASDTVFFARLHQPISQLNVDVLETVAAPALVEYADQVNGGIAILQQIIQLSGIKNIGGD